MYHSPPHVSVISGNILIKVSIIPELQNRVTHYDVTNRVTNSKILLFFLFFELITRCEKNFNIVLELVTRDFKQNKISELLT